MRGVGPVLAAVFVAEIGDVSRFDNPRRLCSWAGLTPRLRESDTHTHRGHITKMACGGARLARRFRAVRLEVIMTIVGGIDIHRAQLTYDYVDLATGEVHDRAGGSSPPRPVAGLAAAVRGGR